MSASDFDPRAYGVDMDAEEYIELVKSVFHQWRPDEMTFQELVRDEEQFKEFIGHFEFEYANLLPREGCLVSDAIKVILRRERK